MAKARLYRIAVLVFLALSFVAGVFIWVVRDDPLPVVFASVLMVACLMLNVPALSGNRVYLGIGAAAAVPVAIGDATQAAAVYVISLAVAWLLYLIFRPIDLTTLNSEYLAEVVAIAGFGGTFHIASVVAGVPNLDFAAIAPNDGYVAILCAVLGGVAYHALRAVSRSLIGLERADLSVRYLWLAGLEDWSAITALILTGTVVGIAYESLGLVAILVAVVPYSFTHTALARYQGTKVTYGQTIQALSQIPEVAGLAPLGHSVRTGHLAADIGREMGLRPDQVQDLEYAGYMHDIGRITLNEPAILRAGFTDLDIARWGSQIISEAPHLGEVAEIVGDQCLPYRSPGQERDPSVSTTSKIIKIVSAYDQTVHESGLPPIDALEQLHRGSAYEYDPEITSSLRRVLEFRGELSAS
ncbi:MAG: HD domain-containing protein [bacterium]|nr:HD domain-containing protein [bacterium]MCP4964806.1 HD domain-containing protein [bacterium]